MIKRSLVLILGVTLATILIAGCGTSSSTTTSAASTTTSAASTTTSAPYGATTTSAPSGATTTSAASGAYSVMTSSNSSLGTFLVDGKGRTLYRFSIDSNNTSQCTGGCLAKWPAFYAATISVSSGLSASDFAQFTRSDGSKQTEYKGQPLYYFYSDTAPGDTKGQGINAFGGHWSVVPK